MEVNLNHPLPSQVRVNLPNHRQPIIYEDSPLYYKNCRHLGHKISKYKAKNSSSTHEAGLIEATSSLDTIPQPTIPQTTTLTLPLQSSPSSKFKLQPLKIKETMSSPQVFHSFRGSQSPISPLTSSPSPSKSKRQCLSPKPPTPMGVPNPQSPSCLVAPPSIFESEVLPFSPLGDGVGRPKGILIRGLSAPLRDSEALSPPPRGCSGASSKSAAESPGTPNGVESCSTSTPSFSLVVELEEGQFLPMTDLGPSEGVDHSKGPDEQDNVPPQEKLCASKCPSKHTGDANPLQNSGVYSTRQTRMMSKTNRNSYKSVVNV
ncbi:uncharacterized protein M6B38_183960 [Iris pallida]|uniref:Uncharacterized protein n=1 Tax=Iris pallida TaxID=29817 RepID=A0AAX6EKA9_IRIPA|nr:uncharacterized protein M6B38_183960 [Iris pallida]